MFTAFHLAHHLSRSGGRKRDLHNSNVEAANIVNGDRGNQESASSGVQETDKKRRKKSQRKKSNKPWVYVEGIPPDATEEELAAHFSKVG